jgi:integrase
MQAIQKVLDSESAQDLSSAYLEVKQSKGLKEGTLKSYIRALDIFESWRTKPYDELNQLDMANFLNELNETGGNSATRKLRLHVVKGFLRWVLTGNIVNGRLAGPVPEIVAYLEIKNDTKQKPQIHITPELMTQILGNCISLKERVFMALAYDTGARLSEIRCLQFKHVGRDEYGNYIELNGKTGYRKNWLHESLAWYLPFINGINPDPEVYLFPSRTSIYEPMTGKVPSRWMRRIVRKLRASLIIQPTDKLTIHGFRHTKARNLKNKNWSEDKMNVWMGWSGNSRMASHYGKAREEDVVNSFLEMTGQKVEEEKNDMLECPSCHTSHGAICKFCSVCGHALKPEYAFNQNEKKDSIEYIAEMQHARKLLNTLKSLPHLAKELGLEAS